MPILVEDFQQLLRDALDLRRELGEADNLTDRSYWDLPSIAPHRQNRGFRDWVSLIELLRDAWLAVRGTDGARATRLALMWFDLPYPTFKRLALFAASHDDCIEPDHWVDWLLADRAWWLWSLDTKREVLRIFVLQGQRLAGSAQDRLEAAILAGPPREMYTSDLEPDRWQDLVSRSVLLRLAKLESSGLALATSARVRLDELSRDYSEFKLATNERDEFSHWMTGTGEPDFEEFREVDVAPRKRHDLVEWLQKTQQDTHRFTDDTWLRVCREHLLNSLYALCDLARKGVWPAHRWREALQVWSEDRMVHRSWRYAASLLQTMPDDAMQEIAHSVAGWIDTVSRSLKNREEDLLDMCRRMLALPLEASSGITRNGKPIGQPVTEAINHPIGHVTQALINLWFARTPNDNDLLPADIGPFFTDLCDVQVDRFRHGRVLLSSRLIAFFRVDRAWTEQHLLPLFDWSNPVEAQAAWEGFLWSPRLYQPLLTAFKPQFLQSAKHYADLGEHRQQFAAFLTYAAIGPTEGYTLEEFRSALGSLPQDGLEESAQALAQALEGAADQREDYWRNRIQPVWQSAWPKSRELATPRMADSLARLAIAAGGEFPAALVATHSWLQPLEHPDYVVNLLRLSGLCSRFPTDALRLLDAIIGDQQWAPQELGQCLQEIVSATRSLEQDASYQRLVEYRRRRGVAA